MEKNKWQLILHEQCEDPYYEITNGPISPLPWKTK